MKGTNSSCIWHAKRTSIITPFQWSKRTLLYIAMNMHIQFLLRERKSYNVKYGYFATKRVSSWSSSMVGSRLDHGGLWVQTPSGTRILSELMSFLHVIFLENFWWVINPAIFINSDWYFFFIVCSSKITVFDRTELLTTWNRQYLTNVHGYSCPKNNKISPISRVPMWTSTSSGIHFKWRQKWLDQESPASGLGITASYRT